MEEANVTFNYQARFYSLPVQNAKAQWLACHGYGQLAKYFLRHFKPVQEVGVQVDAPEGLSAFYLQGTSGRVGASWMTKENREVAIANYLHFLDAVQQQTSPQNSPLTLFGFSQGCATVCRYLEHSDTPVNRLILWAGVFPPDLSLTLSLEKLKACEIILVWGNQDPYLTPERQREQEDWLQRLGLRYTVRNFEGGHQLNAALLSELAEEEINEKHT